MITVLPIDFSAALAPFGLAASALVLMGCAAIVAAAARSRVSGHGVPSSDTVVDLLESHIQAA